MATAAAMIGAVTMSRVLTDQKLSDSLLQAIGQDLTIDYPAYALSRLIHELRLREFPCAVQDFGARTKEPHHVIPARHSRQPIRALTMGSAKLNVDCTVGRCVVF
jgi:hypothetical protein